MFRIFNLHFTDYCDFRCKCCFVEKNFRILSLEDTKKMIDRVSEYFSEKGITDGRINIAGGEPLTCPYLQEIIDYIVLNHIRVSIISNGYRLTDDFIKANQGKIEQFGISIDSLNPQTNLLLGRCCGPSVYDYDKLVHNCIKIKEAGIRLKINIVVSKININEDVKKLLDDVKPQRFKILQMIPTTKFAEENAITYEEYLDYVKKYEGYSYVSEQVSDISDAYVIIDSEGKLSTNNLHCEGISLFEHKISEIEDKVSFNQKNESKRYTGV